MVVLSPKYENLEREVLSAENTPIIFNPEDSMELRLHITRGRPTVDLVMPWNAVLEVGKYASEKEAREEYVKFLDQLKQGYGLHIEGNGTVEIIEPE